MSLSPRQKQHVENAFADRETARLISGILDGQSGLNVGAAASGITLTEEISDAAGFMHRTTLTLTNVDIAVADSGGASGAFGGKQLYDFPEGAISIFGAFAQLQPTAGAGGVGDTATVKFSLGSALEASNDTLDSVQANVIGSTNVVLSGGVGPSTKAVGATAVAQLDGTATAIDLFLNLGVADAGVTASDTITVNGTVRFSWARHGDV